MSHPARLQRLLGADGRCLDVAIDHGFFNEASFLGGIESMPAALDRVMEGLPDAVQLSPGMALMFQQRPGPKPGLVLRTDIANVYHSTLPDRVFSELIEDAVGTAVRLDAACVVVNLLLLPGQPELHRQCVRNVARLRADCERAAMPLMVEPLVMQPNSAGGAYMVDGNIDKIMALVRQAAELGADVIKADPCDRLEDYHRVIEVASGVPVLVRGGGKVGLSEVLRRTQTVMRQGASGIVYGRNIIQHPDPAGITKALMAIVHDDASIEAAEAMVLAVAR